MQKKGLVIDKKELTIPTAGIGPMGRSPFVPNTERGQKDDGIHPTIKGIGLGNSGLKNDPSSTKKASA